MKKIPLTKGFFAIVDNDMFDYLNQWKWHYENGYASKSYYPTKMHQLVIKNYKKGDIIDHINRDKLDNRKINIEK